MGRVGSWLLPRLAATSRHGWLREQHVLFPRCNRALALAGLE